MDYGRRRNGTSSTHQPALGLVVVLLVVSALTGCVAPAGLDAPPADAAGPDWTAIEQRPHVDVTFAVVTRSQIPLDVAGYAWAPQEPPETVVLVVHGGGGLALRQFGPGPVPGYSLAHRFAESGRAVVVIDRPGYAGSDDPGDAHTLDEDAWVVAQIADQLRHGDGASDDGSLGPFTHVIGVGHSMGAYVVMVSQGNYESFDAIVPTAWGHGGFRQGAPQDCISNFRVECILHPPKVDPLILDLGEQAIRDKEADPAATGPEFLAATGAWRSAHPALQKADAIPDADDMPAERIEAPVLMIQGLEDGMAEPTTQEEEEAVFTSTDDLTVVHFEETAHWVFHHLNRDDVYGTIFGWLHLRGW